MTKYTVAVEDKEYKIDLAKTESPGRFTVKINDKPHKLELKTKIEYNKPLQLKLDDTPFTVQIAKKNKNAAFQILIKDVPVDAEVRATLFQSFRPSITASAPPTAQAKPSTARTAIEGAITAPMAGKIIAVRAKKGDMVKANMVVCILEAMKMENEILAQRDGLVKEVFVSPGVGVNKGDAMFVIEPSKD